MTVLPFAPPEPRAVVRERAILATMDALRQGLNPSAREVAAQHGFKEGWGKGVKSDARKRLAGAQPVPERHERPVTTHDVTAQTPDVGDAPSQTVEQVTAPANRLVAAYTTARSWADRNLAMTVVAVAAFVTAYDHGRQLALSVGEGWRAWLWPLTVDVLVWECLRRKGWPARAVLVLALGVSAAANVAVVEDNLAAQGVSLWSPLCLLLIHLISSAERKE